MQCSQLLFETTEKTTKKDKHRKTIVMSGRYQPFHNGHKRCLKTAIDYAVNNDTDVTILIASFSNEILTAGERYQVIKNVASSILRKKYPDFDKDRIHIGFTPYEKPEEGKSWLKTLNDFILDTFDIVPCAYVYGMDKLNSNWFSEGELDGIDLIILNRGDRISGTYIRNELMPKILKENDRYSCHFKNYIPKETLRTIIKEEK